MLQAANGVNVKKTKLMYKSLLGYAQLTELLSDLTENGLLDYNE
jgi:predicted transcriptional regulator